MNKNDIMYALNKCITEISSNCSDCAYRKYDGLDCLTHLAQDALALIKEQDEIISKTRPCDRCKWFEDGMCSK